MSPMSRRRTLITGAAVVGAPALAAAASVAMAPSAGAATRFPLGVYNNPTDRLTRRYLVDSNGQAFRVNAEAAWFASTEFWLGDATSKAQWATYLDDRRAKGFTAILMMGMVQRGYNGHVSGGPPGSYPHLEQNSKNRISGVVPLTTPGDFRTFNDAYWNNVAGLIREAANRGMAVLLAYNYLGFGGFGGSASQGWWTEINLAANADPAMFNFGNRLARLITTQNVIWYPYGDFNPPVGSEGSRRVMRSVEGIKAADPNAIFAAELAPPDDLPGDNAEANQLLDINSFYGYGPGGGGAVYETARAAWDDRSRGSAPRPAWVCEPPYEATSIGGSGSREAIREAQWYSVLGGGTAGQTFGTLDIYCFDPNRWRNSLQTLAAKDIAVQFGYYNSFAWARLVPTGTGRYGVEIVGSGQESGLSYIAAAGSDQGTKVVAYVPGGGGARTFTVNLSKCKPNRTLRWFNPTNGSAQAIGTTTANSFTVTSPGDNGTGVTDWVLDVSAS
jgi:hypothetical protein